MKKKAFILVNVILIMSFLNVITLTTFTIHKKMINSSYEAIHKKSQNIYDESFLYLLDEIINMKIKYIIENKDTNQSVSKTFFYDVFRNMNDIDFDKDILDGVYVSFDGKLDVMSDHIKFNIVYGNDSIKKTVNYNIYLPMLNEDDIKFVNDNTGDRIYEKYKSLIKIDRFSY